MVNTNAVDPSLHFDYNGHSKPDIHEHQQFDLGGASNSECKNDYSAQHDGQNILTILKEKLDRATQNSCITREDEACAI